MHGMAWLLNGTVILLDITQSRVICILVITPRSFDRYTGALVYVILMCLDTCEQLAVVTNWVHA